MNRKKVLVYPCDTEIGLEIYRAVNFSTHFELWGGSSTYDHGRFVYKKHIDKLPFLSDISNINSIICFQNLIKDYKFDFIYPAMDGVLFKLAQYVDKFSSRIIAPDFYTANLIRSKKLTYQFFQDIILTPKLYHSIQDVISFPVFIKPDVGQGSQGIQLVKKKNN
jgi:hypothetical protein